MSLHSQARVRCISQRCTGSVYTDTDTADEVAHPDKQPGPEECKPSEVVSSSVNFLSRNSSQLRGEDNAHNDSVDGDDLAEDNGDQILRPDPWCLDTSSEDGCACDKDSPKCHRLVSASLSIHPAVVYTDHAAPITDSPMQRPIPVDAQA
jgi:hypothetical protein